MKENKDKKRLKGAPFVAAVVGFSLVGLAVIALIGAVVLNIISSNSKVTEASVTAFKSEKQISSTLKSVISSSNKLYSSDANYIKGAVDSSVPTDESYDSAMDSEQELNNHSAYSQFNSKNEADTVKTDDKYIYFLNSNGGSAITVFSDDGDNSKLVSQIDISNADNETFLFKDFYIDGKKLIAIEEERVAVSSDSSEAFTRVEIFDLADIKNIKVIGSFTQSGKYSSSRMADGILYLASTHQALTKDDLPCAVSNAAISSNDIVPVENTYYVENPNEPNFSVISAVNTEDKAEALTTKAVLGSTDDVYFSENSLYISAYEYNEGLFNKQNVDGASYIHLPVDTTQLVKFDLSSSLELADSAKICGYTDSQYSFDENGGTLRVATTVTQDNDKFTEAANIFLLDKDLKCTGKITDFAGGNIIKAVRYIDDTAYVITYKETSPLYVIDLGDAKSPEILSEEEVSGISSTLIPVDGDTLLSVGYYTADEATEDRDGVRLVTLDVSNKTAPKVSDELILKSYESPAQYNSKALLVNDDKGDYVIPMIYENYDESDGSYETKYGALDFKVEDGKINVVNDYTSEIFKSSAENSVTLDRCVSSGDYFYLLGSSYNYYKADGNTLIEAVEYNSGQ